jgi:hypothetical protein
VVTEMRVAFAAAEDGAVGFVKIKRVQFAHFCFLYGKDGPWTTGDKRTGSQSVVLLVKRPYLWDL